MQELLHVQATPVYILSGFLGSGKTTLLGKLLSYWKNQGLKPAVIMNEIGEVNLDGLAVGPDVPMAEMLDGCICCSIRADLSMELYELIQNERPDLVIIEATGAANPMEIFDAVTEASLYLKLDIKPMITVVDTAYFSELYASQQGKTYRLMMEQIRCGSVLVMNKLDRLNAEQQKEARELLMKLNPHAKIFEAVRCNVNLDELLTNRTVGEPHASDHHQHGKCGHEHPHGEHCNHPDHHHTHHSHSHVTVYTHYFKAAVNSVQFERFMKELPREVYRAKGILHFSDTSSRFLFQYAYRESDYLKITPQGQVPDVAVFIGEHFDQELIRAALEQLDQEGAEIKHAE
ncbi:CobW family GTP-binding protein [Paenibacillus brevis]|uniref:GTP-binding protein n=1 Tax=Paenibacillus brevis TaxID=2841508 RepID=A0ABS6FRZ7_9BACL|nr:GTP-binding protein [Paenibacillus brevis]MBU5672983.1 GTP-binding protein [Paenibacillus brevis]